MGKLNSNKMLIGPNARAMLDWQVPITNNRKRKLIETKRLIGPNAKNDARLAGNKN